MSDKQQADGEGGGGKGEEDNGRGGGGGRRRRPIVPEIRIPPADSDTQSIGSFGSARVAIAPFSVNGDTYRPTSPVDSGVTSPPRKSSIRMEVTQSHFRLFNYRELKMSCVFRKCQYHHLRQWIVCRSVSVCLESTQSVV